MNNQQLTVREKLTHFKGMGSRVVLGLQMGKEIIVVRGFIVAETHDLIRLADASISVPGAWLQGGEDCVVQKAKIVSCIEDRHIAT